MNSKKIFIGILFILAGIWIYSAISTFNIEENTFPERLIIKEGIVRTEVEVAEALSKEMGFDLEGAYKSGYAPSDVADYLMKQPNSLSITLHEGEFYQGRKTVPRIIPLSVSILLMITGAVLILFNLKSTKPDKSPPLEKVGSTRFRGD